MRIAIIKDNTGYVENIIEVDGKSAFKAPAGYSLIDQTTTDGKRLAIGGTYIDDTFTPATNKAPAAIVDIDKLAADLEALKTDIAAIKAV
jgi:hypothetical protein